MEKITKSSDKVLIDPNEPLILPDGTALVGRVEWFLYALCCLDYQNLPTPMSRIEEFANALITGEVPNIEPQSRAEQFFLAILDGNISDLPQPQSRSEVLLDKLARGEFDLSDVEPIQSSYELLLAYLIKNGGIGNIDYVLYEFSEAMKTMYNTVEKPFKSLELSGNTLVNCVLEDTENDDYTSFDKDYSGTSFTINGTSEGAIKSAILKGQTLVNISSLSGEITIKPNSTQFIESSLIQQNKTFTFMFNCTSVPSTGFIEFRQILDNTALKMENINVVQGYNKFKVTTVNKEVNKFRLKNDSTSNTDFVFNNLLILDGDYINIDVPYFEGMQSVKMPVLTTTGKNLFDVNGGFNHSNSLRVEGNNVIVNANKAYQSSYIDITNLLITDRIYSVSVDMYGQGRFTIRENEYNGNAVVLFTNQTGNKTSSFNVKANTKYFLRIDNGDTVNSDVVFSNIQLEEGSTATSYEPYKSNILSCNEEVTLRSIKNIVDELDCKTGEVTERIGEVTFKGALNEGWGQFDNSAIQEKTCLFAYYGGLPSSPSENLEMICDKFIIAKDGYLALLNTDEETVHVYTDRAVYFRVLKSKLSTQNVIGFKEWLSQNPFTIQYQLKTESIKTVDLNVVDQNNTKIDKIHVFNETTHVNASSDELTPTVNIGKSVSYPTIIKPNTKYTVDLKRNDKPSTVNLGGTEVTFVDGETRKTITTPSTLTNDKLSYYGVGAKCNEIMLIEGEVERNVDYFTGMQSVVMQNQMPILSTVGKNLFDGEMEVGSLSETTGTSETSSSRKRSINFIRVSPNTSYKFSVNGVVNAGRLFLYDQNKTFIRSILTRQFSSTQSNERYMKFRIEQADITQGENIQIEEGSTVTTYENHKSSILSCNEEVTLRGIGDVKDTLDGNIGELTQRIGEIVLDGGESWIKQHYTTGYTMFRYIVPNLPTDTSIRIGRMLCDKFNVENYINTQAQTREFITIRNGTTGQLLLNVSNEKANEVTVLKEWLSQNPITVQYQLAENIIKTVDLNVVDQDGNAISKIKSYKDVTHLEVTVPKQSLLPNVSAEVATDNSKDMSSLTIKHQEISETQSAIQDNIQSQSDEIDTALMATTEIFESILE